MDFAKRVERFTKSGDRPGRRTRPEALKAKRADEVTADAPPKNSFEGAAHTNLPTYDPHLQQFPPTPPPTPSIATDAPHQRI